MLSIEKIKKLVVFITVAALLSGCLLTSAAAVETPVIQSPLLLVNELSSNAEIISRDSETSFEPGSLVRMTVLYVMARECFTGSVSLNDTVTISRADLCRDKGKIPLKEGEIFTFEQLMYMMYMDYSETAACAAASHIAGSVEAFVQKMNKTVSELGCTGTYYANINGDDNDSQLTTPDDMLLILKNAMQNSVFMDIFSAKTYTVKDTNKSISRSFGTPNPLQKPGSGSYVNTCIGGGVGGFSDTGYASVSLSSGSDEKSKMQLITITAGAETYNLASQEASDIINWTFDSFSWQTIVNKGEAIVKVPVAMGSGTDYVIAGAGDDISVMLSNDISATDFKQEVTIYSVEKKEPLTAPVTRGDVLGEMSISYNGKYYGSVPLVANKDIKLMRWEYFKNEVKSTIRSSGVIWIIVLVCLMLFAYIVYAALFWYRRYKLKRNFADLKRSMALQRQQSSNAQVELKAESLPDIPAESELPENEENENKELGE